MIRLSVQGLLGYEHWEVAILNSKSFESDIKETLYLLPNVV